MLRESERETTTSCVARGQEELDGGRVGVELAQDKELLVEALLCDSERLERLLELDDALLVALGEERVVLADVGALHLVDEAAAHLELVLPLRLHVGERLVVVPDERRDDLVEVDEPEVQGARRRAVGRARDLLRLDELRGREAAEDLARLLDREEGEAGDLRASEARGESARGRPRCASAERGDEEEEQGRTCFSSSLPLASMILQQRMALSPSLSRMTASTSERFMARPSWVQLTAHLACEPSPCCRRNISRVVMPHWSWPDRTSQMARM